MCPRRVVYEGIDMRRWVAAVATGVVMVGALTACDKSSFQCDSGSCEVSVSGTPTVDLSGSHSSSPGHRHGLSRTSFTVRGYDGDGVRINVVGDTQTVRTGQAAVIGAMRFRVESVSGNSAKLHVDL